MVEYASLTSTDIENDKPKCTKNDIMSTYKMCFLILFSSLVLLITLGIIYALINDIPLSQFCSFSAPYYCLAFFFLYLVFLGFAWGKGSYHYAQLAAILLLVFFLCAYFYYDISKFLRNLPRLIMNQKTLNKS